MMKKNLVIGLLAAMAVSLAGCGSQAASSSAGSAASETSSAVSVTSSTTEESSSAAVSSAESASAVSESSETASTASEVQSETETTSSSSETESAAADTQGNEIVYTELNTYDSMESATEDTGISFGWQDEILDGTYEISTIKAADGIISATYTNGEKDMEIDESTSELSIPGVSYDLTCSFNDCGIDFTCSGPEEYICMTTFEYANYYFVIYAEDGMSYNDVVSMLSDMTGVESTSYVEED